MFRVADLLLLNKIDLLRHVDFDPLRLRANIARVNAGLPIIELSARTGQGFEAWIGWLATQHAAARGERHVG